jgi:hypothetical protein
MICGAQAVAYLVERGRPESFTSDDLAAPAAALLHRATRQLETTARAALDGGDVDGSYRVSTSFFVPLQLVTPITSGADSRYSAIRRRQRAGNLGAAEHTGAQSDLSASLAMQVSDMTITSR